MRDFQMTGLALAHAMTTPTPAMLRAIEQQTMIQQTITVRELVDKTIVPAKPAAVANKLTRARELYTQYPNMPRAELITLFIKELGLTTAGATTYYSKLRRTTRVETL